MPFFLLLLATVAQSGPYQVTLRPPAGGLFAQEEMQIEYRVVDTSRVDPLLGPAAVIRAETSSRIAMPSMAGMPAITEAAHAEGIPGEYGIHPVFPHGGDYVLTLNITPPGASPFTVTFPLAVSDPDPSRRRPPPPFTLDLKFSPSSIQAGKPVELRFTVRRRQPRQPVQAFDLQHERLFHLILVSRDLTHFSHEHPTPNPDGSFQLTHTFPAPGDYHLFADVAPAGAGSQVLLAKLKVNGRTSAPAAASSSLASFAPTPLTSGRTLRLTATLTDSAIEPYLGARGHLILIHSDAETFVHSHPDESAPAPAREVPFLVRFPKPGLYHGWAQFQRQGKVETVRVQFTAP